MKHAFVPAFFAVCLLLLLAGCAAPTTNNAAHVAGLSRIVRTTAYTSAEAGGRHDGCGGYLHCSGVPVHSAAADWSRYPVGTEFRIVETGEVCQIDDYGSALVGTDTIDLYKDSRHQMNNWGVRMVHIEIMEWGSSRRSLEILSPRARNSHVRRMVVALRQQTLGAPPTFHRVNS